MNYFSLLGISENENNIDIINKAIEEKKQQWQNDTRNPRKQIQAKENITLLPDILKVMNDNTLREKERKKLIDSKNSSLDILKNEISLLSIKGFISELEFNNLLDKFKNYGFSKEEIENNVHVPIENNNISKNLFPEEIKRQLENYFNSLNIDDLSLYKFYNVSKDTNLIDIADKELLNILQKGNKDFKDEAYQKIAGLTKEIFKNYKQEYNTFLNGNRYIKLNEYIKTGINDNVIDMNAFTILSDIAQKEYSMNQQCFYNYLKNNAKYNNFKIDNVVQMYLLFAGNNNKNDNKEEASEKEKLRDKEELQKKELEKNQYRQEIINFLNKNNAFATSTEEKLQNNKKILENQYNNTIYVNNKTLYLHAIFIILLSLFNIIFLNIFNDKLKMFVLFLTLFEIIFLILLFFLNNISKSILELYTKTKKIYDNAIAKIAFFKEIDRSLLFDENNQKYLQDISNKLEMASADLNNMAEVEQKYLDKNKKYKKIFPQKININKILLIFFTIEVLIILFNLVINKKINMNIDYMGW